MVHTSRSKTSEPDLSEVYLFRTCLLRSFYPESIVAAANILGRFGIEVHLSDEETCCGQPAWNAGHHGESRAIARHAALRFPRPIPLVLPSGSCTAMLQQHYPRLFLENVGIGEKPTSRWEVTNAMQLSQRSFEWSDTILKLLNQNKGQWPELPEESRKRIANLKRRKTANPDEVRVAYFPSCHLLRNLNSDAPQQLLASIPGLRLVWGGGDEQECCGFGGVFAFKMDEISLAIGNDRCDAIEASGADYLVSMDAGCLLQLGGILSRRKSKIKVYPLPYFIEEILYGKP